MTKYVDCQAGHEKHDTKTVEAQGLKYQVYDWEKYFNKDGSPKWPQAYCSGQDIISQSIDKFGVWEPDETKLFHRLLSEHSSGIVVDIGSQIGYFSILSASKGRSVIGLDSNKENIALAQQSAHLNGLSDRVEFHHTFVSKDSFFSLNEKDDIHILKCDIEGNERYAVEMMKRCFEVGRIKYAIIEISPVFNDSYPELVERIANWGYNVYQVGTELELISKGRIKDYVKELHQENFLFERNL